MHITRAEYTALFNMEAIHKMTSSKTTEHRAHVKHEDRVYAFTLSVECHREAASLANIALRNPEAAKGVCQKIRRKYKAIGDEWKADIIFDFATKKARNRAARFAAKKTAELTAQLRNESRTRHGDPVPLSVLVKDASPAFGAGAGCLEPDRANGMAIHADTRD